MKSVVDWKSLQVEAETINDFWKETSYSMEEVVQMIQSEGWRKTLRSDILNKYPRKAWTKPEPEHFEQYFDLRGVVFLPISEFNILKHWM
ncbi:hypothetical protein D3C78_1228620 [compost metagenome]